MTESSDHDLDTAAILREIADRIDRGEFDSLVKVSEHGGDCWKNVFSGFVRIDSRSSSFVFEMTINIVREPETAVATSTPAGRITLVRNRP
jgi:hypothetical protein